MNHSENKCRIITFIILLFPLIALSARETGCKYFTVNTAPGWKTDTIKIGSDTWGGIQYTKSSGNKLHNMVLAAYYSTICDPGYFLDAQVVQKSNTMFRDCEPGAITDYEFNRIPAKKIDVTNIKIKNDTFSARVIAFNREDITYLIINIYSPLGNPGDGATLIDGLDFKDVLPDEVGTQDIHSRLSVWINSLSKLLPRKIDPGILLMEVEHEKGKMLYSYQLTEVDIETLDTAKYKETIYPILLNDIKEQRAKSDLIGGAMDAGYILTYKYYDMYGKPICEVSFAPGDYN